MYYAYKVVGIYVVKIYLFQRMGVRNIGDNEGEIGEWDKFDKENRMRKQISNENKIEN